tara:strand:- start:288 stop:995 length:708 start_codon:yes stop_codon:yes gene_type:complete
MALPVLNNPNYEMELPSTGEKIEYRPFLVKEQKILMIAQESNDQNLVVKSIIDIVRACTFDKIDKPENLPTFDLEYLFLMIRSKSVGSEISINILCPDDNKTRVETLIDIDSVKVQKQDGHSKEIMITKDIGIVMKYPTMQMVSGFGSAEGQTTELTFDLLENSVESIFDKEEIYDEMSSKELREFIESMNTEQFVKLQSFFETMPKLKHTVKVTNPNTGVESDVVIEGLQSFLG